MKCQRNPNYTLFKEANGSYNWQIDDATAERLGIPHSSKWGHASTRRMAMAAIRAVLTGGKRSTHLPKAELLEDLKAAYQSLNAARQAQVKAEIKAFEEWAKAHKGGNDVSIRGTR